MLCLYFISFSLNIDIEAGLVNINLRIQPQMPKHMPKHISILMRTHTIFLLGMNKADNTKHR